VITFTHQHHIQISGILCIALYQDKFFPECRLLFFTHFFGLLAFDQAFYPVFHPLWLIAENIKGGILYPILHKAYRTLIVFLSTDPLIQLFIRTGITAVHMKTDRVSALYPLQILLCSHIQLFRQVHFVQLRKSIKLLDVIPDIGKVAFTLKGSL